jgi:hypothetical protein
LKMKRRRNRPNCPSLVACENEVNLKCNLLSSSRAKMDSTVGVGVMTRRASQEIASLSLLDLSC